FKKGQPWYRIPETKVHYEITVGDDILPQQWLAEKPLPIAARRLNDYLQQYFMERTK
ncbi:MAG: 1-acyl-sn-glycerol-3-phosphate acyltransferase, partial [Neisseria sp.]|nr:1-acyl-sn-glycerol-3-phosphate acyltransferase [Neisseria sp.]